MFLRRKKSKADLVMERVHDITDTLTDKAVDLSGRAAVALSPKVETAREAASSAYEQASTKVRTDIVPRVREDIAPKVRDDAGKVRDTAAIAATAALARARARSEQPKKHRLRKLMVVLGVAGAAAYAAKKLGLRGQSASSFGQMSPSGSSYAPTTYTPPPSRPTAVPDDRASAEPLQTGDASAAGATFATADTELGSDLTDELSEDIADSAPADAKDPADDFRTDFTTTPPTEANAGTSGQSRSSRSKPKPKPTA